MRHCVTRIVGNVVERNEMRDARGVSIIIAVLSERHLCTICVPSLFVTSSAYIAGLPASTTSHTTFQGCFLRLNAVYLTSLGGYCFPLVNHRRVAAKIAA